jgi:hypothetical protein
VPSDLCANRESPCHRVETARRRDRENGFVTDEQALRQAARRLYPELKRALLRGLRTIAPNAQLDERDYVVDPADNLLPGITIAQIKSEFGAGAGNELKTKMRAPWSSSALAVNSFVPWRNEGGLRLAGHTAFSRPLALEAKCPNGVSTIPPHLDVLLERDDIVVGVESKCCEPFRGTKHGAVSPKYVKLDDKRDPRAATRWFATLSRAPEFHLLDTYQLVKHYLGLAKEYEGRPLTLIYLYWEPVNPEHEVFARHRAEIERFARMVDGDSSCSFAALSYREHWDELELLPQHPIWLREHLATLRKRYLVDV